MDLSLTKSGDDTETDTPPHHPIISFATASFHHHLRQSPPVYKECRKNHAAHIGGHAVDGCGEFMPPVDSTRSGATGWALPGSDTHPEPALLKCAACGCHRNFHRRDTDTVPPVPPFLDFRHPKRKYSLSLSPSPPPPSRLLALSAAAEDHHPMTPVTENGRKRFRSKFSEEQKEKMQCFSEKLGWKIQKCDEQKVDEFCREIGVTKGVLKVWMHNNKNKKLEATRDKGRIVNGLEFHNGGNGHGGSNNGSSSST